MPGLLAAGFVFFEQPYPELILRLVVAAVLGGLIGLERDVHGRAAGLRTHLLVSTGSAGFTIMSILLAAAGAANQAEGFVADPGRVAAQIVTGIGFLGAGAIIKEGVTVRGLTTAACLWVVASIGMAAGAGEYGIAVTISGLSLLGLVVLKKVERIYPRDHYRTCTVCTAANVRLRDVVSIVDREPVRVVSVGFEQDYETDAKTITMSLRVFERGTTDDWSENISTALFEAKIPIKSFKWDHR